MKNTIVEGNGYYYPLVNRKDKWYGLASNGELYFDKYQIEELCAYSSKSLARCALDQYTPFDSVITKLEDLFNNEMG
jgi:hypothetical protein